MNDKTITVTDDLKQHTHPSYNDDVMADLAKVDVDDKLVAIDLGSNSFHLSVARVDHSEVRRVLSMSDKVQLASGIDNDSILSDEAMTRGLECLKRFLPYVGDMPKSRIRIVATNALRKAVNRQEFISRANEFLPVPIELIAGREEARLIYLGVSHTNASQDKRLVIDIGGGSTEFIIGQGFNPIEIESLQMGCVSFTKKFFADGKITETAFDNAIKATQGELFAICRRFKKTGWTHVMGSSGTVKACHLAICELGFGDKITLSTIKKLKKYLIEVGTSDKIKLQSIKNHRQAIFAAGVAVLYAIIKVLEIKELDYSDGALREGVMYDMLGRQMHENVQNRSVEAMAQRYSASDKQAFLVTQACLRLFEGVQSSLYLKNKDKELLLFAARLHEIGLAVSHSQYHHHGAYILTHADMLGFSCIEQQMLAAMVRYHRRKLKSEYLPIIKELGGKKLVYLCLVLRLAVLSCQSRSCYGAKMSLSIHKKRWQVCIDEGDYREVLIHQLALEAVQFDKMGVELLLMD